MQTQTATIPLPALKAGMRINMYIDPLSPDGPVKNLQRVVERQDFAPEWKRTIDLIRTGPGGYSSQIQARAHYGVDGAISPWVDPAYTMGRFPEEARAREGVIWSAALGGIGGGEASGDKWCEVWIDDDQVKAESTLLGNKLPVPPGVSYAAFVTGGIALKNLAMKRAAIPAKPSLRKKPKKLKERYAMYWFLRLAYGYTMSDDEARDGLYTPPKRIGWNPKMARAISDMFSESLIRRSGGSPSEPGSRRRELA